MKQCKIIVKDEVNVKIEGLDLSERKTLMKMFEYEIPGARYLPAVRLGRWNGKVSYFSLAGSTYINLLPEILPVLDRIGYDIDLEDLRDYTTTFTFDKVSEDTFKHKNWPKGHPQEGKPVVLRDYQIEIVNNFLENPQSLQEIATGAGKTLMTAALSYSIEKYGDALKTLLTSVFAKVPIRWGLTGTIPKAKFEAQSIFVSLGNVIGKLSASELQDQGVLARCHVNIMQLQDGKEFTNYQSELKHLLEDSERLDKIASLISGINNTGNTLILVDRVNAGKEIVNRLPGSVFVSGATNMNERREEYDEVATSSNKIIVATYGVAAVGINIPRIFNLVLIEPGKSFVRVIQSIGRGIRKAEDKDHVQIYDITSSCKFAKRHLTQRKTFYKEANYPFDLEKLTYR